MTSLFNLINFPDSKIRGEGNGRNWKRTERPPPRQEVTNYINSFIHSYTHQTHIDCVISNTPSVNC